jgi:alpha-D-ribose 1-methylphosphonate 5-triphosphate synthase subunit PhnH
MALAGGFAEPVIAAQASFRAVLDAMAHPGRITTIEAIDQAPAPLQPASYALALTLIDFETPVWLDPALTVPSVTEALAFHCGCPLVEAAERAVFALIGSPADMPPLAAFAPGTPAYPDRSTTLIMQLPSLDGGPEVALEGPGIEDRATIAPAVWRSARLRARPTPSSWSRSWPSKSSRPMSTWAMSSATSTAAVGASSRSVNGAMPR